MAFVTQTLITFQVFKNENVFFVFRAHYYVFICYLFIWTVWKHKLVTILTWFECSLLFFCFSLLFRCRHCAWVFVLCMWLHSTNAHILAQSYVCTECMCVCTNAGQCILCVCFQGQMGLFFSVISQFLYLSAHLECLFFLPNTGPLIVHE